MTNLKQYTVIASGKMRDVAFEKLDAAVNLLGWQKGGRVPAEQFDEWLATTVYCFKLVIKLTLLTINKSV